MATIEVHDGRGGVRRSVLTRDRALLFGSSSECDLVLSGPGVAPVHGRLRYKDDSFRVEVTEDGPDVLVNGKAARKAKLARGDEVRVGGCRVFLISPDDSEGELAPLSVELAAVNMPKSAKPSSSPKAPAKSSAPKAPAAPARRESKPPADDDDDLGWMRDLENQRSAPAPRPSSSSARPPVLRRGAKARREEEQPPDPDFSQNSIDTLAAATATRRAEAARRVATRKPGLLERLFGEQSPGQEKLIKSPIVIALGLAFAALIVIALILWNVIARTTAQRKWDSAETAYDTQQYRDAVGRYANFLEFAPSDPRAGRAKVRRGLAGVHQFLGGGGSYENAVDAARTMRTSLINLPDYQDARVELAELVLEAATGLATRTGNSGKRADLEEAEKAAVLHGEIAGKAAAPQVERSAYPAKIEAARAAVAKTEFRAESLAALDRALANSDADESYAIRDRLVARYADLRTDPELVKRIESANELIRKAVAFKDEKKSAATGPAPDPLGPPLSLVVRDRLRPAAPNSPGGIVFALADGYAYGLDGATGAPLWHIPVGLSSPFAPRPIPTATNAAIAFDARHNELIRIDDRNGKVAWRLAIDGPIKDAPLPLGNQLVLTDPRGALWFIDVASGALQGKLELGRPLDRAPVADESAQYLYVVAEESNLFVITREPPGCNAVLYLGHQAGSIAVAPTRIGPYLMVAENHQLAAGKVRAFATEQDGAKLRPVQDLPLDGWMWSEPVAVGARLFAASDRGGLAAFSIGEPEVIEPFKLITAVKAENEPIGPMVARSRTEGEVWVVGARTGQWRLSADQSKLDNTWSLPIDRTGPARGPIQTSGTLVVATQEAITGRGVVVTAMEGRDGKIAWRTRLGDSWPAAPRADGGALITLALDAKPLPIPADRVAAGGFLEVAEYTPPPSSPLPVAPWELIATGPNPLAIPRELGSRLVASGKAPRTLQLPATLAAPPILWGNDLLAAMDDGRVFRIDPATGGTRGAPLIVPFDRAAPRRWDRPRLLGDGLLLSERNGSLVRLRRGDDGAPAVEASGALGTPLLGEPATTAEAVIAVTNDLKVHVRAARDLSPQGASNLRTAPATGPASSGGQVFLSDAEGFLLCYGPNGALTWQKRLPGAPLIGPPVVRGNEVIALGRDGLLHRRALVDGTELARHDIGFVPAGTPLEAPDGLIIPAGPGTLRRFDPNAAGTTDTAAKLGAANP